MQRLFNKTSPNRLLDTLEKEWMTKCLDSLIKVNNMDIKIYGHLPYSLQSTHNLESIVRNFQPNHMAIYSDIHDINKTNQLTGYQL